MNSAREQAPRVLGLSRRAALGIAALLALIIVAIVGGTAWGSTTSATVICPPSGVTPNSGGFGRCTPGKTLSNSAQPALPGTTDGPASTTTIAPNCPIDVCPAGASGPGTTTAPPNPSGTVICPPSGVTPNSGGFGRCTPGQSLADSAQPATPTPTPTASVGAEAPDPNAANSLSNTFVGKAGEFSIANSHLYYSGQSLGWNPTKWGENSSTWINGWLAEAAWWLYKNAVHIGIGIMGTFTFGMKVAAALMNVATDLYDVWQDTVVEPFHLKEAALVFLAAYLAFRYFNGRTNKGVQQVLLGCVILALMSTVVPTTLYRSTANGVGTLSSYILVATTGQDTSMVKNYDPNATEINTDDYEAYYNTFVTSIEQNLIGGNAQLLTFGHRLEGTCLDEYNKVVAAGYNASDGRALEQLAKTDDCKDDAERAAAPDFDRAGYAILVLIFGLFVAAGFIRAAFPGLWGQVHFAITIALLPLIGLGLAVPGAPRESAGNQLLKAVRGMWGIVITAFVLAVMNLIIVGTTTQIADWPVPGQLAFLGAIPFILFGANRKAQKWQERRANAMTHSANAGAGAPRKFGGIVPSEIAAAAATVTAGFHSARYIKNKGVNLAKGTKKVLTGTQNKAGLLLGPKSTKVRAAAARKRKNPVPTPRPTASTTPKSSTMPTKQQMEERLAQQAAAERAAEAQWTAERAAERAARRAARETQEAAEEGTQKATPAPAQSVRRPPPSVRRPATAAEASTTAPGSQRSAAQRPPVTKTERVRTKPTKKQTNKKLRKQVQVTHVPSRVETSIIGRTVTTTARAAWAVTGGAPKTIAHSAGRVRKAQLTARNSAWRRVSPVAAEARRSAAAWKPTGAAAEYRAARDSKSTSRKG